MVNTAKVTTMIEDTRLSGVRLSEGAEGIGVQQGDFKHVLTFRDYHSGVESGFAEYRSYYKQFGYDTWIGEWNLSWAVFIITMLILLMLLYAANIYLVCPNIFTTARVLSAASFENSSNSTVIQIHLNSSKAIFKISQQVITGIILYYSFDVEVEFH
ncbi:hypothetical protein Tco_1024773, partial [Tanacetum coccineum]